LRRWDRLRPGSCGNRPAARLMSNCPPNHDRPRRWPWAVARTSLIICGALARRHLTRRPRPRGVPPPAGGAAMISKHYCGRTDGGRQATRSPDRGSGSGPPGPRQLLLLLLRSRLLSPDRLLVSPMLSGPSPPPQSGPGWTYPSRRGRGCRRSRSQSSGGTSARPLRPARLSHWPPPDAAAASPSVADGPGTKPGSGGAGQVAGRLPIRAGRCGPSPGPDGPGPWTAGERSWLPQTERGLVPQDHQGGLARTRWHTRGEAGTAW
jgi:hypothetical protein